MAGQQLASLGIRDQWPRIGTWLAAHSATAGFLFVGWFVLAVVPYLALIVFALRRLMRRPT